MATPHGNTYLKHFYPNTNWGTNPFATLNKSKAVIAEIVIPVSANNGHVIYLKVVDGGGKNPDPQPNSAEYGCIDISTAVCALKKYKHLFPRVTGYVLTFNAKGAVDSSDGGKLWRESGAEFLFADSDYDPINGHITNYGPDQIKNFLYNNKDTPNKFRVVARFKTSTVKAVTTVNKDAAKTNYGKLRDTGKTRAFFFVKFMVLKSRREIAEKALGYKLPDDIIIEDIVVKQRQEAASITATEIGVESFNKTYKVSGNLSEEFREILSKQVNVTKVKYSKPIEYQGTTYENYKGQLYRGSVEVKSDKEKSNTTPKVEPFGPQETGMLDVKYRGYAKLPDGYPMIFDPRGNNKRRATAWREGVHSIVLNKDAAPRFEYAFKDIYNHYGPDIKRFIPSACIINNSLRTGSDSKMHETGFAIDLDYWNNLPFTFGKNRTTPEKTRMNKEIYTPMLDIMEYHGIRNLGRDSMRWGGNVGDWMHCQAALTKAAHENKKMKPYYVLPIK